MSVTEKPLRSLAAPEGMSPGVGMLYAALAEVRRNLKREAGRMTQAQIEYAGPDGDLNSAATLLAHLARAEAGYAHLIREGRPAPEEWRSRFGPAQTGERLPAVTGRSPEELLAVLDRSHAYMRETCLGLTDADLHRLIEGPRARLSVAWILWHVGEHEAGHLGQILTLQRMQGLRG